MDLCQAENEGTKFWLSFVAQLKKQDIGIICIDGLNGFPEAIEVVYSIRKFNFIFSVCNRVRFVSGKI